MMDFAGMLEHVRKTGPLVQCVTNIVTVNDCANVLLAAGASPFMADDPREAAETAAGVHAVVCNMGAMDKVESMRLAGRAAAALGKAVVLDPVAAGGTALRREAAAMLLREVQFTAIRGNASEVKSLAALATGREIEEAVRRGVDVSALDTVTEENLRDAAEAAARLARKLGTVIAVSGVLDIVTDGERTGVLRNGCETMARITGSGCMLTSLVGAFCGALRKEPFAATVAAMALLGVAGEQAEKRRLAHGTGNATFRTDLIDAVFNMSGKELQEGAYYEEL